MSMGEDTVGFAVHLAAVEHVLAHTLNLVYRMAGVTAEQARQAGLDAYERAIAEPIPGATDPVLADHASAELANAVDTLMQAAARLKAEWDSRE